ncbi:MAG TPA: hypothetical protein VGE57_08315 [Solimonas sp.]
MRVDLSTCSFQVHPEWDVTRLPDRLMLSAAEDGGELELSYSFKEHGKVTQAELQTCVTQLGRELAPAEKVSFGPFSGLRVAGFDDPLCVCWWFLSSGPMLLRGFYNGWQRASETERAQIEQMLSTMRRDATLG